MKRIIYNNLGIEIEIKASEAECFKVRESRNCVRISHDGKRVITILQDSKVEFCDFAHVVCYKGRVVAFNNACVEAGRLSKVFAKDKSRVLAYRGAEVRAGGRVKVRALDSRVIAGGRAEVFLDGESIGYKWPRSRAKMNVLDNRVKVFNLN